MVVKNGISCIHKATSGTLPAYESQHFACHGSYLFKNPSQIKKKAAIQEWKKLGTITAWQHGQRSRNATLMDICHLNQCGVSTKKLTCRVVLRGDIVKDDSGAHTLFTQQATSATQMTGAKLLVVIRVYQTLKDKRADAVLGDTEVKMKEPPRLIRRMSKTTTTQRPQSWTNIEDPVVPLERYKSRDPPAGLYWERQFEETVC